jgi:hypothetical protein
MWKIAPRALVHLLRHYFDASTISIGSAAMIAELARVVGFAGQIGFDTSRPDGTPRELLDVSRLTVRLAACTGLGEVASTYRWLDHQLTRGRRPRGFSDETKPLPHPGKNI